jgi:hypothetical protein
MYSSFARAGPGTVRYTATAVPYSVRTLCLVRCRVGAEILKIANNSKYNFSFFICDPAFFAPFGVLPASKDHNVNDHRRRQESDDSESSPTWTTSRINDRNLCNPSLGW